MGGSAAQKRRRLACGLITVAAGWVSGAGAGLAQSGEVQDPSRGLRPVPLNRQAPVFTYREVTSKLPSPSPAAGDAGRAEPSSFSLPARPRFPAPEPAAEREETGLMGRFDQAVAAAPARAGLTAIHPERESPRQAGGATPLGTGRASWYQHAGKAANGERYDPNRLTAAHHSLPFGTKVKVVNKRNGRSVVVEITDRTNERTKRKRDYAIDLSRASARTLGIEGIGLVALYKVD